MVQNFEALFKLERACIRFVGNPKGKKEILAAIANIPMLTKLTKVVISCDSLDNIKNNLKNPKYKISDKTRQMLVSIQFLILMHILPQFLVALDNKKGIEGLREYLKILSPNLSQNNIPSDIPIIINKILSVLNLTYSLDKKKEELRKLLVDIGPCVKKLKKNIKSLNIDVQEELKDHNEVSETAKKTKGHNRTGIGKFGVRVARRK